MAAHPIEGRPKPCDLKAEQAILSAVLCSFDRAEQAKLMGELVPLLAPSHFYGPQHQSIWTAMLSIHGELRPIDIVTLRATLSASGQLDRAGGVRYLAQLFDEVPATAYPLEYARIVVQHARVRRTIAVLETAAAQGYALTEDQAADYLARVQRTVSDAVGDDAKPDEQWVTGAEIFAPLPPVAWVCKGLALGPGRPHTLVGFGYSGKTVAAQALALAVASGGHAWGRFSCRQGVVVHLDHEVGKRGTLRRYQRLAFALGIAPHHIEDRLRILPLPRVKLSDAGAEQWLTRTCTGVALCIIDSLRACIGGDIDENDSAVRSYLDILLRVSDATGCTFVVLHHAGKGRQEGDQREAGRGSSAIYDASGTVLKLDPQKTSERQTTVSKVVATKMAAEASGGALEPFWLRIADVASDDGADERAGLSCSFLEVFDGQAAAESALLAARKVKVLETLSAYPDGLSKEQVRRVVGGDKTVTDGALLDLEREKKVRRSRRTGKGGGDLWALI
jgi:hypothetical protein